MVVACLLLCVLPLEMILLRGSKISSDMIDIAIQNGCFYIDGGVGATNEHGSTNLTRTLQTSTLDPQSG